jgi:N-terminal domain of anti-restriction factor ArdC
MRRIPPSRSPGTRSRYEPRHLSSDHGSIHRVVEPRHRAVAEALLGVQNIVLRKPYREINALLLGSTDYQSPFWITFKQTLDLGGHVRKGERSAPVIYYKILEKRDEAGTVRQQRKTHPHCFRPVGECFQSRPDRGYQAFGDRGSGKPDATVGTCRRHCRKREALPDPPRGIFLVLFAPG